MARKRQPDAEVGLVETVQTFLFGRDDPNKRLLRKRDKSRRGLQQHTNVYVAVNIGLFLLNVLVTLDEGRTVMDAPFSLIIAILWGIGLGIHTLSHRSWVKDNERAFLEAEVALGRLPEFTQTRAPAPVVEKKAGVKVDGVEITSPEWLHLIDRAALAADNCRATLDSLGAEQGSVEARAHLKQGLEDLKRLAAGAERIGQALSDASGADHRAAEQIYALDERINASSDDNLREVLMANRAHLVARRAKIVALEGERARMFASAEGFLLATENLRLDAARLGAGQSPGLQSALAGPLERLGEEVAILRRVEAELARY